MRNVVHPARSLLCLRRVRTRAALQAASSHGRSPYLAALTACAMLASCEPSIRVREADALPVNPSVAVGSHALRPDQIRSYLADALGFTSRGGRVFCSYTVLGQGQDQVYLATACEELVAGPDSLESGSGSGGPVALVVDTLATPARITGHRRPRDGGLHARDIREIFPESVQRLMLTDAGEHDRRVASLQTSNREAAAEHYARYGRQERRTSGGPCVAPSPEGAPGRRVLRVYYACEAPGSIPGQLYPAFRAVAADAEPAEAALRELVRGPTAEERVRGLRSHLSERTANALLRVTRSPSGDTITVDFAADLPRRLPDRPEVRSFLPPGVPAEITWTLFQQLPEVQALRLRLDGDERAFWSWLGGEPRVYTRRDWERV